jgi:SWI/SNF-related matrix-associated actin-dependent regulator 1 of chromatin subfamily A
MGGKEEFQCREREGVHSALPYSMVGSLTDKELIDLAQFGVVIADESSHNMKTMDAKRTTVCLPFLRNAQIAVCLSGTPVLNRPVEIFAQLEGLLPDVFTPLTYTGFTKRYCDAKPHRFRPGDDVSGVSNEAELRVLLEGLVMIRRLKENVLQELPEKQRIKIDVEPDEDKVPQLKAI